MLRFTQELNARLAEVGIDGIGGAIELYRRLREVLDGIPGGELERTMGEVQALAQSFLRVAAGLEEIRRLKTLVRAE